MRTSRCLLQNLCRYCLVFGINFGDCEIRRDPPESHRIDGHQGFNKTLIESIDCATFKASSHSASL